MDSQKDDKDRQTTYTYDEFGRSKKTTYVDGRWEKGGLNWVSAQSTALYCVTQTSSTDPTVKTYFDALDRVVRKSQMGIGGKEILIDLVYDSYGRVQKESLPFYGSSASAWKNTSYDTYDRPLEITESSGGKESFGYGSRVLVYVENEVQTNKYFDEINNVTGTLCNLFQLMAYTYRPDRQPKSIVVPGGTITYGYDKYGRKILRLISVKKSNI